MPAVGGFGGAELLFEVFSQLRTRSQHRDEQPAVRPQGVCRSVRRRVAARTIPQIQHRILAAEKPKSDLYRDLLPELNSGKIELHDHPKLISQLCNLERRTARGGRDSIDHPPNGHDDVVNAVAGAVTLTFSATPQLKVSADIVAKARRWTCRARKDRSPPQRRVVKTFAMPSLISLTFFAELGKFG
jgi:hypothetical protein